MEMVPSIDVSGRHVAGGVSAVDTVEGSNGHLKQYVLMYWQLVKHITRSWLRPTSRHRISELAAKFLSAEYQPEKCG